jgi:16S rRNA (uracil1498-N3)-methyltransferase
MPRFFLSPEQINENIIYISGKDLEHLRVLRLRIGETLTVCDGRGRDYRCRLLSQGPGGAEAEVLSVEASAGEPSVSCMVYAGLPKGDKTDYIIQKSVELGAREIVFFLSERCVARPDKNSIKNKLERWNKISEEASKQCLRGQIPGVFFIPSFEEMLASASKADLGLFFWEDERELSIKKALDSSDKPLSSYALVTGPEGGFEKSEAALAVNAGLRSVTLGSRILRCDTAPLCVLSAVMYHTDNLK